MSDHDHPPSVIDPPRETPIEPIEFAEGSRANALAGRSRRDEVAYIIDLPFVEDARSDETPLVDVRLLAGVLASWKTLRQT